MSDLINLKRRILDISHKHKLGHLGSCLSAVEVINEIYNTKKKMICLYYRVGILD